MAPNRSLATFSPDYSTEYKYTGFIQNYVKGIIDQWLLIAPLSNPAMLEIFRTRNSYPLRKMVPWAGEFAGKYLTSAVQVLRLSNDERLRTFLSGFVSQLISLQDADGYLGPWRSTDKLTGTAINQPEAGGITWDAWGHYHILLGLLLWYEESGDSQSLKAAEKIGDLFVSKFLGAQTGFRLVDTGSTEMNMAPAHGLCLLYQHSPKDDYKKLVAQLVEEFSAVKDGSFLAGDYYQQGIKNIPFYQTPKPRWESLHPIMSLVELYYLTGNTSYRKAFENLWWSMTAFDVHNNGGFTSGEQATGNPYDQGAIETCCTIAYLAMSVEMLKLTGNPLVADVIEWSTYNQITGAHSFTGRWATYNTPMDGVRNASAHSIVFQANSGSPELNCCSVNSPRGFGMISDWAVMYDSDSLIVNCYEPGAINIRTNSGQRVKIILDTEYPLSPIIKMKFELEKPESFTLNLRIPVWSDENVFLINGKEAAKPVKGRYYKVERRWQDGDTLELTLDFRLHFWTGEKQFEGRASIYRGPLLLAYDQRYNMHLNTPVDTIQQWIDQSAGMPALDCQNLNETIQTWKEWFPPKLLIEYRSVSGEPIFLCDYASAGTTGTSYITWLKAVNTPSTTSCTADNPLHRIR